MPPARTRSTSAVYEVVNLYDDANAYVLQGEALKVERPSARNYLGEVFATQRDANYMELVTGDHGRSGGQYDIWTGGVLTDRRGRLPATALR